MRILISLLTLFVLACSPEDRSVPPPAPTPSEPITSPDTTIRYLALGDSYTIGTSVEAHETYARQLATALRSEHQIRMDDLRIVARNGWRTDNLANALNEDEPSTDYDLVSLLIGVNDQYQGFKTDGYEERFTALLDRAIGYAGGDTGKVFVISIPDYAYTPFGGGSKRVSRELDEFNRTAKAVAERYDIPFYNITPISREGLERPELVADDDLHPSGLQYGRWVNEVLLDSVAARIRAAD